MVHHFLASAFTDADQATQYATVLAALQADAGTDALLLGNLVLEDGATPIDAVVLRPHGITLLVLVPRGGRLGIPALGYGVWQLGGVGLPGAEGFDNPHEQYVQQKNELAAWLGSRFTPEQANLRFITGAVLFGAPVTFAPDVEAALNGASAGFQLLSDAADLPRRLRQLATPEIDLSPADLAEWAAELQAASVSAAVGDQRSTDSFSEPVLPKTSSPAPGPTSRSQDAPVQGVASGFLGQKAGALWRWLGAADVPDDDPTYGYDPDAAAARAEEKQHLEHLRQQMQADLNGQLQALEAREAERERSIAQLRAELAQAPPVAAEAAALVSRLGAETREKAALEAAMQASRAESAARNQELDSKIQQLGQLIEQLNARPDPAPSVAPATGAASPSTPETRPPSPPVASSPASSGQPVPTAAAPTPSLTSTPASASASTPAPPRFRQLLVWRRRLPRLAVAAGAVAVLGFGAWGLSHLGSRTPVPFQENGRWGYADAGGKPVVPAQFTAAGPFQGGKAVVAKDNAYGMVDEDGKEVVVPAYDALNPYVSDYARARVGDAYTFLDKDGQEFDHFYFNALDFAEGHAAVLDHRGWHYISGPTEPDKSPVVFTEAYSFTDGLARVKLPDGFTFITAEYLADPSRGTKPFGRYELAADFVEGKAWVTQAGRRFQIDKDGEEYK